MFCDDSFLFKMKNLLLYNKLPQNLADSNNCFILKVRDSGRAQLGSLSLICMLSVEVAGAGGSPSQIAFSLLHLVPGLGWLTVASGSWKGAWLGAVSLSTAAWFSMYLGYAQHGNWVFRGSVSKRCGWKLSKGQAFLWHIPVCPRIPLSLHLIG